MEVDGLALLGGRTNDLITGLTSVTYGGNLNVLLTSLETNSVIKLFSAGSYSGAFDTITPATPFVLPPQYAWDTSFLAVDGTLRITFARPRISTITLSGNDLVLDGTDAIAGMDYVVLSTTDLFTPISQWTPIQTNNIGSSTFQITLTGQFDPAAPQRFYLLKLAQ